MATSVRCPNPKCKRKTFRVEMRTFPRILSGGYHYEGSCPACGEKAWCHADQDAKLRVGMWQFGRDFECEGAKKPEP